MKRGGNLKGGRSSLDRLSQPATADALGEGEDEAPKLPYGIQGMGMRPGLKKGSWGETRTRISLKD